MPAEIIRQNAANSDWSARFAFSAAVTGSPAASSETIVCTIPAIQSNAPVVSGVYLIGNVAFTVGTNGVSVRYRIKQTNTSGTTLFDSGVTTAGITAANLVVENITAWDTAPVLPGQVYVLTLTVGSGSATSTVSAANLTAIIV